jgi:predicted Zn-dependent protease
MMSNGLMAIHTGLLLRLRNEAQLAAVIGHEAGHYLRRHQLQRHRRKKTVTAVSAFASLGIAIAGARTGVDVSRDIQNLQFQLQSLYFSYERNDEAESDAFGVKLLEAAGYAPGEASEIWDSVIRESESSAKARGRRYRANRLSYTDTHPTSASRSKDLKSSAAEINRASVDYRTGADSYKAAMVDHLPEFLEEQVKLNDPGAALYLIGELKKNGTSAFLEFQEAEVLRQRGEPGDELLALAGYQKAVISADVPAEAVRGLGNSLLRLGRRQEAVAPLKEYISRSASAADKEYVEATLQQLEAAP